MSAQPSTDMNGSQIATAFNTESFELDSGGCGCFPQSQKFGQFHKVRRNLIHPSPVWGDLCRFYRIEQLNTGAKLAIIYVPPTAEMNFTNDLESDLKEASQRQPTGTTRGHNKRPGRSDQNRFKVVTAQIEDYRPNTNESAVSKRSLPPILPGSPYIKGRWKKRQSDKKKRKNLNTSSMLKLIVQPTFTRIRRDNTNATAVPISPEVILNPQLHLDRRPSNQSGLISPILDMTIKRDVPVTVRRHSTISDDIETLPDLVYSCQSLEESTSGQLDGPILRPKEPQDTFDPSGIVLFFIHGVGGCALVWRKQIVFFKEKGYGIVAFDLIGHGRSPSEKSSDNYQFGRIMRDVLCVFDNYSSSKNVVLAHSYGTCFAAVLARERSSKISHLLLISSGGPTPPDSGGGIFSLPCWCLKAVRFILNCVFQMKAFGKSPTREEMKFSFGAATEAIKLIVEGQVWPQGDWAFYRLITTNTLLIHGLKDKLITLEEMLSMSRAIPGARLVGVEDAGHMVMCESPDRVNVLMEDFIVSTVEKKIRREIVNDSQSEVTNPARPTSGRRASRGLSSRIFPIV